MEELISIGRKRTILISISILMVTIHTIYYYHAIWPEIETKKLVEQGIRLVLTMGLLIFTFQGRKWARITSIVLFSLATLGAIAGVVTMAGSFANKIPLLVMIFVYSMSIYHFGFSKYYKAFFESQNRMRNGIENK